MSRLVRAAALSVSFLSLAAADAAAAPHYNLPCTTHQGHNVNVTNNTGREIPRGARFIVYYYVAGKFDKKDAFTLTRPFPANTSEYQSYMGPPLSGCAVVVKFPPRYATKVNPAARAR